MNEEQETFLKFCMFGSLLMAPLTILGPIYAYLRDLNMGRQPSLKAIIAIEIFFILGNIYAYWFIKRMGWDFWKKNK